MSSTAPDAIIVIDDGGDFMGYFSVRDYREATRRLEAHLLMAARLSRSRKAITEKKIEEEDTGGTSWTYFWEAMMRKRKLKSKFRR